MTIMTRSAELKSYLLSLARPETKEKLYSECHSGLGRSKPRMSSRNFILWALTIRKSKLQNLSLMTGVSWSSPSSLLTQGW